MKKLLCIVFALIFVTVSIIPAFASQGFDPGHTPLVVVSGMGSLPLIADKGLPTEKQVWPLVIDKNALALAAVLGLGASAVTGNINKLADALIPVLNKTFEPAACNADGDSKYNVTVPLFPKSMAFYPDFVSQSSSSERGLLHTACDALGADYVYFFKYDWRLDPLVNADALNVLIQTALRETGQKKVDLAIASSGGNQALAYFAKYGGTAVESCVFICSVFDGSLLAGDIFNKRIGLDKNALKVYAKANTDTSDIAGSLEMTALDIFDCVGGLGKTVNLVNKEIDKLIPRIYNEVLAKNFCTYPGLWAEIRENDFEAAKSALLDPVVNAKLIARIDDFHYNVRVKRQAIINNIMKQGVQVAFCSNYNSYPAPFYPSANQQSDDTVESACTSAGAYFAPLGSTLPAGYVQKNYLDGKNYISPDNIIDASASMFPDKVWFFKDLGHVGCPYKSEHSAFVLWLLWQEKQPTVWTDSAHPQFMGTHDDGQTLYPLAGAKTAVTSAGYTGQSNKNLPLSQIGLKDLSLRNILLNLNIKKGLCTK